MKPKTSLNDLDAGQKPSEQEGTDVSVADTEVREPDAVQMFIQRTAGADVYLKDRFTKIIIIIIIKIISSIELSLGVISNE